MYNHEQHVCNSPDVTLRLWKSMSWYENSIFWGGQGDSRFLRCQT